MPPRRIFVGKNDLVRHLPASYYTFGAWQEKECYAPARRTDRSPCYMITMISSTEDSIAREASISTREDYITRVVENAFDMASLMSTVIKNRDGFRLVLEPSCTNVCFMYIPPSLRNQKEDDEWKEKIDQVRTNIFI